MNLWTVAVEKHISDDDVWNLLVGAFEGGSNYWINHIEVQTTWENAYKSFAHDTESTALSTLRDRKKYLYNTQLPVLDPDARISVYTCDHQPELGAPVLTMQTIGQGLDVMARDYPRHFDDFVTERYDADTSDVFLQCCLFNKVVYG